MIERDPSIGTQEPQPKPQYKAGDYVILNYSDTELQNDNQKQHLQSTIWKVKGTFVRGEIDQPERKYRVDPVGSTSSRGIAVYDQTELIAAEQYSGSISFYEPGSGFKYIDTFDAKTSIHQEMEAADEASTTDEPAVCPVCGCNRALYIGSRETGIHYKQCAACGCEPHHS